MGSFVILFKKELKSNLRTHRILIVAAVFFVLGLGTPLILKYLHVFLPADTTDIVIPEFAAIDVIVGYLDSLGQVGLLLAILVAMGSVARERESGTAAMTLSKPVGCGPFVAAKLAALALVFAIGIVVGAVGCYLYTAVLFESTGVMDFFLATLLAALYLLFCLAVTVMYSCFFKSQLPAGGLALVTLIALTATSSLPVMKEYSPGALLSWSESIVSGSGSNAWGAVIVSLGLIVLTAVIGWQVFKVKEL
ncbi:MAG: ABC transporter permease subunit [Dehalococcoidia bacterium]|nr:ABC transporter permease subunit [Dehalococcoidia bacterium]